MGTLDGVFHISVAMRYIYIYSTLSCASGEAGKGGWGQAALDDTALPSFLGRFLFLIDKIIQKTNFIQVRLKYFKGEAQVYFTLLHLFQVDSTGVQVNDVDSRWTPPGMHLIDYKCGVRIVI